MLRKLVGIIILSIFTNITLAEGELCNCDCSAVAISDDLSGDLNIAAMNDLQNTFVPPASSTDDCGSMALGCVALCMSIDTSASPTNYDGGEAATDSATSYGPSY